MHFLISITTWILFPLYLIQGLWFRSRADRSFPAEGVVEGSVEGKAPFINLLVIGDSSAASAGIAVRADGLATQLARQLAEKTGRAVNYTTSGHHGAVAEEIRDLVVPNTKQQNYSHIVIALSTNDIKNFHTVGRWIKGFGGLLFALHARFPHAQIWWMRPFDFRVVPRLTQPLTTILNLRAILFSRAGAALCEERGAHATPPLTNIKPEDFCPDGFHAGEKGFQKWAAQLSQYMMEKL